MSKAYKEYEAMPNAFNIIKAEILDYISYNVHESGWKYFFFRNLISPGSKSSNNLRRYLKSCSVWSFLLKFYRIGINSNM